MGLLGRVGRLAVGARRGGARSLIKEAREAAEITDALANYALVTGAIGGLGGGLMSASDVQSRGGTQEDINEAGYHGGRTGAVGGPLAFGPAVGMTAAMGPVGAAPIVPWALATGSEGSRRFDERQRKREEQEAAMRALEMQLMQNHRR